MFKNILLKAVASTAAVGSALAMSVAAGPALTTASPEIRTVAEDCPGEPYPASVSTTTEIKLERSIALYGVSTDATATVTNDEGAAAPDGRVRFILKNDDGSVRKRWNVDLSGGRATVTLPRTLPSERTYGVRVRYFPPSCSVYKRSSAGPVYYIVRKAGTRLGISAPNVHRGHRAQVHVKVRSASPLNPHGRVKIVIKRHGNAIASQVHRLHGGRVDATFRRFRPGYYKVKVRYFGARNFRGSSGDDAFRVYRR